VVKVGCMPHLRIQGNRARGGCIGRSRGVESNKIQEQTVVIQSGACRGMGDADRVSESGNKKHLEKPHL